MTIKLYQPCFDNNEVGDDFHSWRSGCVYLTKEDAIAEITERGFVPTDEMIFDTTTLYVRRNFSRYRDNAYVIELTLGGDVDGVTILRKAD